MGITCNGYRVSFEVMNYSKIDCGDGLLNSVNVLTTTEEYAFIGPNVCI